MIVVDNDVVAFFWIKSDRSTAARRGHRKDADWHVPRLWRSEFRSMLRQHMVIKDVPYSQALWYARKAERMLRGQEHAVSTSDVLKIVERTGHSAYDCEYVALAQALGVALVTGDRVLPRLFPKTAVLLEDFVDE